MSGCGRCAGSGDLGGICEESGIPELKKTTRDEPDYDKLMKWRLGVLKEQWAWVERDSGNHRKDSATSGRKRILR